MQGSTVPGLGEVISRLHAIKGNDIPHMGEDRSGLCPVSNGRLSEIEMFGKGRRVTCGIDDEFRMNPLPAGRLQLDSRFSDYDLTCCFLDKVCARLDCGPM